MEQAEITALSRRGIRELAPDFYSDDDFTRMTTQGVLYFGMIIKEHDPSFYNERTSLTSNTHVFSKPSDCLTLLNIWDMKTNAVAISGAADNGSGLIRITTSAAHGFSDGAIVLQQSVGGCTEANGTWQIDYDSDTHATTEYDLVGSTFSNAYTSGGYVYEDVEHPWKIDKKLLKDATLNDQSGWYPRGDYIVVDDKDFTNDIIVDYIKSPSAITDIPAEYHMGLVAFNVIHMIRIPAQENPAFSDLIRSSQHHQNILALVQSQIDQTFQVSNEPEEIAQGIDFDNYL